MDVLFLCYLIELLEGNMYLWGDVKLFLLDLKNKRGGKKLKKGCSKLLVNTLNCWFLGLSLIQAICLRICLNSNNLGVRDKLRKEIVQKQYFIDMFFSVKLRRRLCSENIMAGYVMCEHKLSNWWLSLQFQSWNLFSIVLGDHY